MPSYRVEQKETAYSLIKATANYCIFLFAIWLSYDQPGAIIKGTIRKASLSGCQSLCILKFQQEAPQGPHSEIEPLSLVNCLADFERGKSDFLTIPRSLSPFTQDSVSTKISKNSRRQIILIVFGKTDFDLITFNSR